VTFKWEQRPTGQLRFFGKEAMRTLMGLLKDDDDYTWSIPAGWPAPFWIDVYPRNKDAEKELLELVGESE
jgi:hypothetical protein